jgi:hypothetical protein
MLRSLLLALVLVSFTGCSLATRGPGRDTFNIDGSPAEPDCTDSYAASVLDTLAAVALVALGAPSMACDPDDGDLGQGVGCIAMKPAGTVMVVGGVIAGGVSLVGHSRVSQCRAAKQRYHARIKSARTHVADGGIALPETTLVPTLPR